MKALWFEDLGAQRQGCLLCPHACELGPGTRGICRIRENKGGMPTLTSYAQISTMSLDPIEKKPLYRFMPGTPTFSIGFYGCNMRCPYCQNWEISQCPGKHDRTLEPEAAVGLALDSGAPSIAFTYSEPSIHFEYLLEASRLAHKAGLQTILVTNGNLNQGPARELLAHFDAVNLDIKCFAPDAYSKKLHGNLEAVVEFARLAATTGWLEITTLVVPSLDNWDVAIEGIAGIVSSISPEIALHISAYHPAYRYTEAPTQEQSILSLVRVARSVLRHVYEGNIRGEKSVDRCNHCGTVHVSRIGYQVACFNLIPNPSWKVGDSPLSGRSLCRVCGFPASIVVAPSPLI